MDLERPLPQPITPEAKPYWDGLPEQKLMLPRCRACRRAFFYPRVLCPHCHAADIEWLILEVKRMVLEKTGVDLVPEVRIVGEAK